MKTTKKVIQILLPLVLLLAVLASCGQGIETPHPVDTSTKQTTAAKTTALQTTSVQSTVSQTTTTVTEPPISYVYVNGADEMTLEEAAKVLTADDIELSARMGYVTHLENDIYSGKEEWHEFVSAVNEGLPAKVRLADFSSYQKDSGETVKTVSVREITYDGKLFYSDKYYNGQKSTTDLYRYMMCEVEFPNEVDPADCVTVEIYLLTNNENLYHDNGYWTRWLTETTNSVAVCVDRFFDGETAPKYSHRVLGPKAEPKQYRPDKEYLYVNGAGEMTLEEAYELLSYDNIELSEEMGYVTHIGGDILSGTEKWEEFVRLTREGTPAVVRGTGFYSPRSEMHNPVMHVYDLAFDGNVYWWENVGEAGREESCYAYLTYIEEPPTNPGAAYEMRYVYVLSNYEATSYFEQFVEPTSVGRAPEHETPWQDCVYKEQYKDRDANYGR